MRLELEPQARECAVKRNLHGIRLHVEKLPDLAGGQICAVAKRNELSFALVELGDSCAELDATDGVVLVPFDHALGRLLRWQLAARPRRIGDAPPRDTDQPRRSFAAPRVETVSVAQGTLKGLARDVICLGAVADAIRDVRVHTANELPWILERIDHQAKPYGPELDRTIGHSRIEEPRYVVPSTTAGLSTAGDLPYYRVDMPASTQSRISVRVPFLDLGPSHATIKEPILTEIAALIDSGAFTNGPQVAEFEAAFASLCNRDWCVGAASGLDALRLALIACGLETGDEVILPANTFVATAEAITQAGGTPVLADVGDSDYNLDPAAVEAAITPRTRFLLPVHLYGQLADMRALTRLAERHRLEIVEDACQAHGAERDGLGAGKAGAAAAFSFYPGKNLGAFGDAGAIVLDSEPMADRLRALREHGQWRKYHHDRVGWTARLDTIQAIVLLAKLSHLGRWNDERRAAAAYYLERLAAVGDLILPPVAPDSEPVWHLFVVRTTDPNSLAGHLRNQGIGTGRHYPQPIHLTAAYAALGQCEGAYPVTEAIARECLSLPIYPGITEEQLESVADAVVQHFAHG